jgi:glycine cleavage system protein P-like pyridoxal-binding family
MGLMSGHPSTWQAEVEALRRRLKELEDALREISDIAKVSEGPAAQFCGMLADKALKTEKDKNHVTN